MRIRAGYEITYECPRPTPMVLMLSVHPSRLDDLAVPAPMVLDPQVPAQHRPPCEPGLVAVRLRARRVGALCAICDYVHGRLAFGCQHASATRTAWEGFREQRGVCRDFAHLAITLCRA